MDQQRDRERLETMLEQCRRLSGAASDPTTSMRFAKLIEELVCGRRNSRPKERARRLCRRPEVVLPGGTFR